MSSLLEQLRALPTMVSSSHQEKTYPFSLLPSKIPVSGLIEVCGALGVGKTEVILRFLKENPSLKTAWIETDFTFYPGSFLSYQLNPERVLLIDLGSARSLESPLWCASQILKSQIFQVVIFSHTPFKEVDLRRLQLLAKQTGALMIFLNTTRSQQNWMFSLQLEVKRLEGLSTPQVMVLKSRSLSSWHTLKG